MKTTPPTPTFDVYHFYQDLNLHELATLSEADIDKVLKGTNNHRNIVYNQMMTAAYQRDSDAKRQMHYMMNITKTIQEMKFHMLQEQKKENGNFSIFRQFGRWVEKVGTETAALVTTTICAALGLLAFLVAWKCGLLHCSNKGQPAQTPTVVLSPPAASAPALFGTNPVFGPGPVPVDVVPTAPTSEDPAPAYTPLATDGNGMAAGGQDFIPPHPSQYYPPPPDYYPTKD